MSNYKNRQPDEEFHLKNRKKQKLYQKNPATIDGQLEKLRERGCIIEDEAEARATLSTVNYYRLAYYFAIFLEDKNKYREGTSFNKVVRIYDFDRKLRNLLLDVLEEIEVAMRAYVSNYHALKYGATGYMNSGSFGYSHRHQPFLSKIERIVEANGDSTIVLHHVQKYDGSFPLWAIMELFSFGMLNTFYCDMKPEDKDEIAEQYFGVSSRTLDNWLHCMGDLRNHCAHYHRLYANGFDQIPKQPKNLDRPIGNTVFDYVLIIKALYCRKNRWNDGFVRQFRRLLYDYRDVVDLEQIGFPENWEEMLIQPQEPASVADAPEQEQ